MQFVEQAENFKRILKEEKESFEQVNQDLQAQFSIQLKEIPMLEQKLADVAEIPQKIDDMITRLEQSNSQLYSNFIFSTRETLLQYAKASKDNKEMVLGTSNHSTHQTSWIVIVCAILIAIACSANAIHNIWFAEKESQIPATEQQEDSSQYPFASDSTANDTTVIDSVTQFQ